jgi:hypothetical protein
VKPYRSSEKPAPGFVVFARNFEELLVDEYVGILAFVDPSAINAMEKEARGYITQMHVVRF